NLICEVAVEEDLPFFFKDTSFNLCSLKAWKKLKGEDIGLRWNSIKRTVDASNDWWESRLKMFMVVIATGDKAWSPSSGTFCNEFFEDVNNDILEENEEENARNDVHIFNDVHTDGN
ncbi:hypothetical protein Golob_023036, partial [Gossypium lobatum]|nr:hypothetical protein [Gossypium lobatum]